MMNTCPECGKLLAEGDKVIVTVRSTYHVLKSMVAYALDKASMEAIGPLEHDDCNDPKLERSGD